MVGVQSIPGDRAKRLLTRLTSSPVLPVLGWTKVVEAVVVASPAVLNWVAYAVVVTVAWVFADDVQRRMDAAVDAVDGDGGEA